MRMLNQDENEQLRIIEQSTAEADPAFAARMRTRGLRRRVRTALIDVSLIGVSLSWSCWVLFGWVAAAAATGVSLIAAVAGLAVNRRRPWWP